MSGRRLTGLLLTAGLYATLGMPIATAGRSASMRRQVLGGACSPGGRPTRTRTQVPPREDAQWNPDHVGAMPGIGMVLPAVIAEVSTGRGSLSLGYSFTLTAVLRLQLAGIGVGG